LFTQLEPRGASPIAMNDSPSAMMMNNP
jgi:hypothetical protein